MVRKMLVIQTREGVSRGALEPNPLLIELELKLFVYLIVAIFLPEE